MARWATSIARPITSSRPAVSAPNRVRTAIRWVRASISRRTSMRLPAHQRSAVAAALCAIVAAYDRT